MGVILHGTGALETSHLEPQSLAATSGAELRTESGNGNVSSDIGTII